MARGPIGVDEGRYDNGMKVLVLGAGVIGVTSAWALAEAGHEVIVVERRGGPALETSFANGGQIAAAHAEPWARPSVLPKLARWIGREDAPMLFRWRADPAQWRWAFNFLAECLPARFERNVLRLAELARYSREQLVALRERTGIEYDCLQRGILHFCSDAREFTTLARQAEAMRRHGAERRVLSAAECVTLEPALGASGVPLAGGVYTPSDESGDAQRFTQALAALAAQRGVTFRYDAPVSGIELGGGRVRGVRLARGEVIEADATVVALGSYSPRLLVPLGVRVAVFPLKGYSITLPLKGAAPEAPTVSLTDEAFKIVISRLGSRLRAAGTAELAGYDLSINRVRCAAIVQRVQQLFPALAVSGSVEYWAGLRPATPSNVPIVGRARYDNLFLNTGHGTLGWTLACGSAQALADLVSGRAPAVPLADLPAA
ncbi:MAG: D-amino acid dehydrogenase [Burkholderiales bacterium]|nr:D-amino acid dehydrogenase [Burkholderiales bacterium]